MTGRYGTQDAEYRADVLRYHGVGAALRTIISDVEHGIDRITHQASAAPAAAAVTIEPTTGGPVSNNWLGEAKTIGHDLLDKLEAVDEEAVAVVDAIKVNPVGVSITNTLARIAHLPDPNGLLSNIDSTLKAFEVILAAGAQATAPAEPSFTPAGPQVAGQA